MRRFITLSLVVLLVVIASNARTFAQMSATDVMRFVYLPLTQNGHAPSPSPANPVKVKSAAGFVQNDTFYVPGEIINTGNTIAHDVRIRVSLYDASKQLVATQDVYTGAPGVLPGAVSPFKAHFSGVTQADLTYTFEVSSASMPTYNYRKLTIVSHQARNLTGTEVYGEVRNDNAVALIGASIYITFYDSTGNVVDVTHGPAHWNRIAPGLTTGYNVNASRDIPFATYRVEADGKVQE